MKFSRHTPVLLQSVIESLNPAAGRRYIDATVGEGGHLEPLLDHGARVLAIDWDPRQINQLKLKIPEESRVIFAVGNFAQIEKIAITTHFAPVDGILFDLGLSMSQHENGKRGFSYQNGEEPLDMRLNDQISITAADLINNLSQTQLYEIIAGGSEEINSRTISEALVRARRLSTFKTVSDLIRVLDSVIGHKDKRVYSRVFQALRIAVNDEFHNLKSGLQQALNIIKPGGRIVVITFHSLEDRIVKNFAKTNQVRFLKTKKLKKFNKKIFERSAQIRIIQKQNI